MRHCEKEMKHMARSKFIFVEKDDGLYIISPYDAQKRPRKVIKGWESFSGWYWFAFEEVESGLYYGLVQGFEEELGHFSEEELKSNRRIWEIKKHDLPYSGRR